MEFLPYMRGCQLSVWWNVAEYLGCQAINRWGEHSKGANVNNPPSHTWCAPTCCPAAQQQCQFTEYIVPPQSSSECRRAPVSTAASWRGKFQEKGTVQLFSVPPDPAPSPHWCLSALQGAIEGLRVGRGVWGGVGRVKDYFLREASSDRRAKSSSTWYALRPWIHASPVNLVNISLMTLDLVHYSQRWHCEN